MRTNIDIDEKLIREVMALTGARTKREAVDDALKDKLRLTKAAKAILALRGNVEWEGDLDTLRRDK